ncbi:hypothetical protein [Fervidibacillus halotolerans]|uniref:Uncharacterized protein n=1 Tax=Fervidibacillus halotolerans TaxID=2980027 RepID=A0A9E8S1F0_9BACI|nr:hypothetical protein [Fervidibacillus halotolerans]WAA13457.1 hypothetical protein OE105_04920 [Fervidibacillus halotolerans]
MQSSTFNQQFQAIALERIENIRLKFEKNKNFQIYGEFKENIEQIETLLPKDQQHLASKMKDLLIQMKDEYDVQIFKQGFIDGMLFYKEFLEKGSYHG